WYADRDVRLLRITRPLDKNQWRQIRQEWWSAGEFLQTGNVFHEVRWMAQAHALVAEGLAEYLALLTAEDHQDTARAALHLLAASREAGGAVVQAIDAQLMARAGDELFAAEALRCLGALLPDASPLWERHLARLAPDAASRPLGRYAAAVALARYRPTATPPEAVVGLPDALRDPQGVGQPRGLLGAHDRRT